MARAKNDWAIFSLEMVIKAQSKGVGLEAGPQISLFACGAGIFLSEPAGGFTEIPFSQLLAPGDS